MASTEVIVLSSLGHDYVRRLSPMQRLVDFAREREVLVHDLKRMPTLALTLHKPPSIMQAEGAKEVAVEFYSLTKSFSMAGDRFLCRQQRGCWRLGELKVAWTMGPFSRFK